MIRIKICGLSREGDIEGVNRLDINDAGFVFADSPRKIDERRSGQLRALLRPDIDAVGVFVNEVPERIVSLVQRGIIQKVQLHGDEDQKYISRLKSSLDCPIIKAVRVKDAESVTEGQKLGADILLLDTYVKGQRGGSGQVFDLEKVPPIVMDWYMAGGLTPENIIQRLEKIRPYGVDVSSGVETEGCKDMNKIIQFVSKVREFEKRTGKDEMR